MISARPKYIATGSSASAGSVTLTFTMPVAQKQRNLRVYSIHASHRLGTGTTTTLRIAVRNSAGTDLTRFYAPVTVSTTGRTDITFPAGAVFEQNDPTGGTVFTMLITAINSATDGTPLAVSDLYASATYSWE